MYKKILIILSNLSSLITFYIGIQYEEYLVSQQILTTSFASIIYHGFDEFNATYKYIDYFRLVDFFMSYMSIYIICLSLFLTFDSFIYNYTFFSP